MQLEATVTKIFPEESGSNKEGKSWKMQNILVKTKETYPQEVLLSMFNNQIIPLTVGQSISANISVSSKEYNGKYYTSCRAFGVVVIPEDLGQPIPSSPNIDTDNNVTF